MLSYIYTVFREFRIHSVIYAGMQRIFSSLDVETNGTQFTISSEI